MQRFARLPLLAAATACAVAGLLAASAAGAAAATRHEIRASSSNWAGYVASRSGVRFRRISASWVEPQVTCGSPSRANASVWVGLGGYHTTSSAIEQIGTDAVCSPSGVAHHSAWYELLPAPSISIPLTIRPGDRLVASVAVTGPLVRVHLANATRGTSFTKMLRSATLDLSSAEWIVEAPAVCATSTSCRATPLADFGSATITSARATSVTGHTGAIADPTWAPIAIDLRAGQAGADGGSATTGPLAPSGGGFTVAFQPAAPAG